MWDLAPDFGAALVFAEHRYYGNSQPFGNHSYANVSTMSFLSSEQALADFALLVTHLKEKRLPNAQKSPVIAFGGSYGGMLTAWMRIKASKQTDRERSADEGSIKLINNQYLGKGRTVQQIFKRFLIAV
jgi:hypothetical protein